MYIYTLSYYHHQIGSMNYYPLFRVRSWNNGVRCISFYILMCTICLKDLIFGPFWTTSKSKLWTLITFSKFSLVSYRYCFTYSLRVLSVVCGIWASDAQFWGHFGPKTSQNSGLWSFSQKVFTGFTSVLLHMLIASTFRGVMNMGLRGPILFCYFGLPNNN